MGDLEPVVTDCPEIQWTNPGIFAVVILDRGVAEEVASVPQLAHERTSEPGPQMDLEPLTRPLSSSSSLRSQTQWLASQLPASYSFSRVALLPLL